MVRPLRDDLRITPTELGHVLDRIRAVLGASPRSRGGPPRNPLELLGSVLGSFRSVGIMDANGNIAREHSTPGRCVYVVTPVRITNGTFKFAVLVRDGRTFTLVEAYGAQRVERGPGEDPLVSVWGISPVGHEQLFGANLSHRAGRDDPALTHYCRIQCAALRAWAEGITARLNIRHQKSKPRKEFT